jgi:hypothetical protein
MPPRSLKPLLSPAREGLDIRISEAGNAAIVTALEDPKAELAEVKASLQDFVQGRFSFTFTPVRSRMLPQGWDPLLSQG